MEKVRCTRCQAEEAIPTHQYVKFDGHVQYLCAACWQVFRKWFFASNRIDRHGGGPTA
jgi:DNA-directed RNA polymerase subunit RPC12/RpoP